MVLQPSDQQRAAVRQQQTVHVLGLVHAAGRGKENPRAPTRKGAAGPAPDPPVTPQHSQVVENDEPPSGHALQAGFGQEQDTVLQALDLADVIAAVHLEGRVALQSWPKEGGGVALEAERGQGCHNPVSQWVWHSKASLHPLTDPGFSRFWGRSWVLQTREGSSDLSLDAADTDKKSQHSPRAVRGEAVRGLCSEN